MARSAAEARRPPQLVSGDHLTRVEFERRYDAMPGLKKAELVEGVVFVGSPLTREHGALDNLLAFWLRAYANRTPGVEALGNPTVRLDEDNEPQPDQVLRLLPEAGGRTRVEDGYLAGAPELVAEVALSSASHDLHRKKEVYRRHGVREYVVVVGATREVRWFRADAGAFVEATSKGGALRSRVFPGLWLDPRALLAGDGARVERALERGLRSPEHAAFLRAQGRRRRSRPR